MADYFFDSSALAKTYVSETGTIWVRSILDDPQHRIYISSLAEVEIVAALTRRFKVGDLSQQELDLASDEVKQDCREFVAVPVTEEIVKSAVALAKKYFLRAYDSVQLATALAIRRDLLLNAIAPTHYVLVSADLDLNAAAVREGVVVEDPNSH